MAAGALTAGAEWCLMESDPGVFTELIRGFGCTGVQVEEIYSLDQASLENLRPVHGLIFLFKWRQGEESVGTVVQDSRSLYDRNSMHIMIISSFSRQQMFEFDAKIPQKDDDVYHFVAYVPINIQEMKSKSNQEGVEPMDTDQATSLKEFEDIVVSINTEITRLQGLVAAEDDKMLRYKVENIRRKHNYLPLIMELLKILANQGKLVPMVEKEKELLKEKKSQKAK
ncbi:ubiquitin carboxyl-terminal hydrolase isozyme L5 [Exaiptasia diaphana]|uniref:ubiquitinyl hydrolase 1 n=1 Tax=Exaiptasia diaphana TaxID=2652724 RepID=A0A913YQZ4_EXADI|nr:ubiquitin carboxyl-terminal hydrolase isozyme L5 [Exaiptasia diaphana]